MQQHAERALSGMRWKHHGTLAQLVVYSPFVISGSREAEGEGGGGSVAKMIDCSPCDKGLICSFYAS